MSNTPCYRKTVYFQVFSLEGLLVVGHLSCGVLMIIERSSYWWQMKNGEWHTILCMTKEYCTSWTCREWQLLSWLMERNCYIVVNWIIVGSTSVCSLLMVHWHGICTQLTAATDGDDTQEIGWWWWCMWLSTCMLLVHKSSASWSCCLICTPLSELFDRPVFWLGSSTVQHSMRRSTMACSGSWLGLHHRNLPK